MQPSLWLALAGAGVLISFTPGAGAINTMSNSLNSGFRRSLWGILGQQAALVVHILIVALGVGVLVASSPVAFNVIRYAGAGQGQPKGGLHQVSLRSRPWRVRLMTGVSRGGGRS